MNYLQHEGIHNNSTYSYMTALPRQYNAYTVETVNSKQRNRKSAHGKLLPHDTKDILPIGMANMPRLLTNSTSILCL